MISPQNYDQVSSVLSEISSVLDQNIMCNLLEQQAEVLAFQEVIGSTDVGMEYNLIDDDSSTCTSTSENDELHDMGTEEEVDFIGQLDDLDVDQVMATGVTAVNPNGVDAVHLSKIWRISTEDTKRMLSVNMVNVPRTQCCHKIMEPMTACCSISISMNTFSWTHSLLPARVGSPHMLPTFCDGQGVPICGANEAQRRSVTSD